MSCLFNLFIMGPIYIGIIAIGTIWIFINIIISFFTYIIKFITSNILFLFTKNTYTKTYHKPNFKTKNYTSSSKSKKIKIIDTTYEEKKLEE